MDFGTAFLYVLAVLGIIVVAGLVIYLLASLVVSIIDKKEVKPFGKSQEAELKDDKLLLEDKDYSLNLEEEKKEEPAKEEPEEITTPINLSLADDEKKQIEERQKAINSSEAEDLDSEKEESLDEMYQRLIANINMEAELDEKEPEAEVAEEPAEPVVKEVEVVEPQEPEAEEPVEVAEEPAEEPKQIVEEPAEEPEQVVEEPVKQDAVDSAELEALREQVAQLQAQKDELAKQLEQKPTVQTVEVETESLENLLARRAVLADRLASSEKDLKANKKEYIPLSRIKRNLETDKAKLRRKEAVVAKQKVVLFGVNNYVVDPEKEKKLSEDLDILEALRLSVQHCEEVMKENEDRYPILEKTNGILTKQVEDLKADIADIDARIAKLQDGQQGESNE